MFFGIVEMVVSVVLERLSKLYAFFVVVVVVPFNIVRKLCF